MRLIFPAPNDSTTDCRSWISVLAMLTTSRRFSCAGRRVSVIVPSPSMSPAIYAASSTASCFARDADATANRNPANKRRLPGFLRGTLAFGGGGGTVVPSLSRRPGLCLHPSRRLRAAKDAGRLIRFFRSGSWCRLRRFRLSQSMSLYTAKRVGPVSPLGVATSLARRQGSPNEPRYHFALTSKGDHCNPLHQSNPRPQALDVRLYVRSCFFIFSPHATRRAGKTLGQRL